MVIRRAGLYGAASMARTLTPDLVELAVIEVASAPGGIHRSVLWAAVAARLAERDPQAAPPDPDRVLRALGMCIVRGELDEVDGRVVLASAGPAAATA
jgi:hypothetical protein